MSASKSDFGAVPARSKDVRSFLQGLKHREWRHISWGLKPPPRKAQRTVATYIALFALRFYKVYLSAVVGGTCRFEPTCSVYAYEAIERFGVLRGSWLALKRLLRCHPLSTKFGYDPVPETLNRQENGASTPRPDRGRPELLHEPLSYPSTLLEDLPQQRCVASKREAHS